MVTHFDTLPPQAHLDEAVQTLLQTGQGEFPVVDGAGKPVGVLGRADLIRAIKTLGPDARVADAMTAELPTIGHRRCLEDAFKLLQQKNRRRRSASPMPPASWSGWSPARPSPR